MNENTMLLLEKIMDGEDFNDYFCLGSRYLVNKGGLKTQAEYIKLSEKYRIAINKSHSITEIAKLGILCICELTGDRLLLQNLNKIEAEEGVTSDKNTARLKAVN